MRNVLTLAVAGTLLTIAAGCSSSDAVDDAGGPRIVVTTNVLGNMVTEALGDIAATAATVEVIMPIGADPHDFAPSARQAEVMEDADLLVVNGLGFEAGMIGTIESALDAGAVAFSVGGVIEPVDDVDPHVWMDPSLIATAFAGFTDALFDSAGFAEAGIDRSHVERNVSAYVSRLDDLDTTISEILEPIPEDRRLLVTNHESLSRFADRYGFEVVGTIIPSLSTGAAASAADLEALGEIIRQDDIGAIFAETTESDRLARSLADEVGGSVQVVELFTESLGDPGTDADSYIGFMTINAERIAESLS
jgi:zinc/manganese transport system substrate-binding protein